MLVYTRKDSSVDCNGTAHRVNGDNSKQAKEEIPTPPPRVLDLINSFNAAHERHAKCMYKSQSIAVSIEVDF